MARCRAGGCKCRLESSQALHPAVNLDLGLWPEGRGAFLTVVSPPFCNSSVWRGHLLIPIKVLNVLAAAVLHETVNQWDFKKKKRDI